MNSHDPAGHVVDEGFGPAILCLHGFPENLTAFDDLAGGLVAAGFRVIRFNQRGYRDEKTTGPRREYTVVQLACDAVEVLDAAGVTSCVVLGHDLGGLVAWELARAWTERVDALIILAMPHPGAFLLSLAGVRQLARAWYFLPAQLTPLATCLYDPRRPKSRARFRRSLGRGGLREGAADAYLDYLSVNVRFLGAIRWYQAFPFSPIHASWFRCERDVLLIHGSDDRFTTKLAMQLSRIFVAGPKLEFIRLEGASHWLADYNSKDVTDAIRRSALRLGR